jgi:hypothetical protein
MDPEDISGGKDPSSGGAGGGLGGWTAAIGIAGLAISAIGQQEQSKAQGQVYQADVHTAQLEQQVNEQRRQQMNLTYQRQSIENLRNVQKAQASGLAAATNQGAQFGSGLQGGRSQEAAQGAWTMESLSQNFQIGNQMFNLDNQINQQKILKAQAESSANKASGLMSLGGDITKGAGGIAQLASLAPLLLA